MSGGPAALDTLRADIARLGIDPDPADWAATLPRLAPFHAARRTVILPRHSVGDRLVFIARGIACSEQLDPDGGVTIARFFEPGQFCANLTSALTGALAEDEVSAVTEVEGIAVPFDLFVEEYLHGRTIGLYFRHKVVETLHADKELLCAKTATSTEARYRALETLYAEVTDRVPDHLVARAIGITPQGLSRFLRQSGRR